MNPITSVVFANIIVVTFRGKCRMGNTSVVEGNNLIKDQSDDSIIKQETKDVSFDSMYQIFSDRFEHKLDSCETLLWVASIMKLDENEARAMCYIDPVSNVKTRYIAIGTDRNENIVFIKSDIEGDMEYNIPEDFLDSDVQSLTDLSDSEAFEMLFEKVFDYFSDVNLATEVLDMRTQNERVIIIKESQFARRALTVVGGCALALTALIFYDRFS